ncbi:MAG: NADH-quinone oxidoreductase subunit NuoG [Deltaproteobacteria bacterium]|nr:NADH-quinone oxidoreductase subunit NuoG [Deltaproteobacteria bacterium]
MPKLIIDDIPLEVPDGTTVLEAARSVDIPIPHFCWHPALGRAGACRVCAVKMLDGPVKGLQMSCMLPAQEGMVVSTTDPEAMAMRKGVIEWLMINHPHDCPVCDEGGECQLQDFTIAGGHGLRRYDGRKRTYNNQYLGEFIEHEMNRCIQCYRCARFYQEYAGGTDFGVMGRAAMVYFGRQQDGPLESPFSGNLVDICPTGVFTDKTARFRARYWDYDMAPSVCPHCSLGCNITPAARYRELLKVIARRNDKVNGWFICDRGRFSNQAVNAPERPRQALLDGKPATRDEALETLVGRLTEFLELHGPESLAIVGSPRMSLEGNIMAGRLRELIGAGALCYFNAEDDAERTMQAVSMLNGDNAASQHDVREADLAVILDCDLLAEAPMMALAVRQAWRNGARVYVVGRGNTMPFEFVTVASLADVPLTDAKRPVFISGIRHKGIASQSGAKLAFILDGPNAFGCALLARDQGAVPLSTAIAGGKVRGIVSFEADIPAEMAQGIRILAAADWRATETMQRAEIVLPATAWVEQEGTFVNHEGRAQRFRQVMQPGLPIKGLDPAGHPPRVHRKTPPGGDLLPSWLIAAELLERLSGEQAVEPLSGEWERLRGLDAEGEGFLFFINKQINSSEVQ